jgi:hypothetical protein
MVVDMGELKSTCSEMGDIAKLSVPEEVIILYYIWLRVCSVA